MIKEIEMYKERNHVGKDARLFKEWEMIDRRYENSNQGSYIIRKRNGLGLPIVFDIIFNVKTIIGVQQPDETGMQKPVFGNSHVMRISLPNNYPSADGQPEFMFTTDVWHPNVRFFGDFKGRVCLNTGDSGVQTHLVDYIDRVISYLMYEDYHARNEYPYPEDLDVAEWVLKQAEPKGWVNFDQ
jgi:ubiquitin-protein ligase